VDKIRLDLGEIIWGGVDWIGLVIDLVNEVMNLGVP
jgi:hypothetical protein